MSDGIGLAEVLLGLPGFRVLDVIETDAEVVIAIETTAAASVLSDVRGARRGAGSDAGRRPRSGLLRAAGTAGVVEAAVALPGAAVSGADVDRDLRARRRAGGADPAGRCRGVPPGR